MAETTTNTSSDRAAALEAAGRFIFEKLELFYADSDDTWESVTDIDRGIYTKVAEWLFLERSLVERASRSV